MTGPSWRRSLPMATQIRNSLILALSIVTLLGGMACQQSEAGGAGEGPGHRAQVLALTPVQELQLGRQAYREVLSKGHVLPKDSRSVQRVRGVGQRIIHAVEIEPLRREINLHYRPEWFEWEFNVLEDKSVNAFCLPGGKVAVFTGLLAIVEDDDQLATVMGHEISHALAHHASERIAREHMTERALGVLNGTAGSQDPRAGRGLIGVLAAGAAEVRGLAYNRGQESEADHIGIFLMGFAGYDPREAVKFWERMEAVSAKQGRPPEVLSDHPSDAHRIAGIKGWVPQVEGAKRAYERGNVAPAR